MEYPSTRAAFAGARQPMAALACRPTSPDGSLLPVVWETTFLSSRENLERLRSNPFKRGGKIGDQVVRIFKADVQSHEVRCGSAADGTIRIDRQCEAFKAAPAIADAEQLQAIHEKGTNFV